MEVIIAAILSALGTLGAGWYAWNWKVTKIKADAVDKAKDNSQEDVALYHQQIKALLQEQTNLRKEVWDVVEKIKEEKTALKRELEAEIDVLRKRISELVSLNEALMTEKITWMNRALNAELSRSKLIGKEQESYIEVSEE